MSSPRILEWMGVGDHEPDGILLHLQFLHSTSIFQRLTRHRVMDVHEGLFHGVLVEDHDLIDPILLLKG